MQKSHFIVEDNKKRMNIADFKKIYIYSKYINLYYL